MHFTSLDIFTYTYRNYTLRVSCNIINIKYSNPRSIQMGTEKLIINDSNLFHTPFFCKSHVFNDRIRNRVDFSKLMNRISHDCFRFTNWNNIPRHPYFFILNRSQHGQGCRIKYLYSSRSTCREEVFVVN